VSESVVAIRSSCRLILASSSSRLNCSVIWIMRDQHAENRYRAPAIQRGNVAYLGWAFWRREGFIHGIDGWKTGRRLGHFAIVFDSSRGAPPLVLRPGFRSHPFDLLLSSKLKSRKLP